MLSATLVGVGFFFLLFPGSRFFAIAFANCLAVYACIFVFFTETNFDPLAPWAAPVGFVLPIFGFLSGALWRRRAIRSIVTLDRMREERQFARIFRWLIPIAAAGALTFLVPSIAATEHERSVLLVLLMGAIAIFVTILSRAVCVFLIDTGILFEEFFDRAYQLLLPAFAFLTFNSLFVIVYASLYRIVDRISSGANFVVGGEVRDITFSESLYFSVVALSTLGYGDIVPRTYVVRVLMASEIVLGLLLLLFGFSEIMAYSRERRRRREG